MKKNLLKRAAALISAVILAAFCFCGCENDENFDSEKFNDMLAGENTDVITDNEGLDSEALTIAFFGSIDIAPIITKYESMNNVKMNVISYGDDEVTELNTKLMAKDSDIDIFCTLTLDTYLYIKGQYFTDLGEYEELKTRIESDPYTEYVCKCDDKYIGIPVHQSYYNTAENDKKADTVTKYLYANINVLNDSYKDKEGEELYKVLKHLYNNPDDPKDNPLYDDEIRMIHSEYLIMSPFSEKKEQAADFLALAYDMLSGEVEIDSEYGQQFFIEPFIDIDDMEGVYLCWQVESYSITSPVRRAVSERLTQTDGSDEALKKLAKEAANDVLMRMQG